MMLEIDADGWVQIIGALGVFVTVAGTALVGVIMAFRANQKLDAAAQRREEIASSPPGRPEPPSSVAPPKE